MQWNERYATVEDYIPRRDQRLNLVLDGHHDYNGSIGGTMQQNSSAKKATPSKVISLNKSNFLTSMNTKTRLQGVPSHEPKKTMDRKMRYQRAPTQRQPHKGPLSQVFLMDAPTLLSRLMRSPEEQGDERRGQQRDERDDERDDERSDERGHE